MAEDQPEIIYSEHSGDYLVNGERLEVVNGNDTSVVWENPFIADGVAWKLFERTA